MGCADLVVEQCLQIYDVAGVIPIVTGAGGFAGDWNLNPVSFDFSGDMIAASSRELAAQAVRILKK
jgi:fructose-1,6-bisphosphatase/inositol monophosphatase family enzyme